MCSCIFVSEAILDLKLSVSKSREHPCTRDWTLDASCMALNNLAAPQCAAACKILVRNYVLASQPEGQSVVEAFARAVGLRPRRINCAIYPSRFWLLRTSFSSIFPVEQIARRHKPSSPSQGPFAQPMLAGPYDAFAHYKYPSVSIAGCLLVTSTTLNYLVNSTILLFYYSIFYSF